MAPIGAGCIGLSAGDSESNVASRPGSAYARNQASVTGEGLIVYYVDDPDQLPELPDPGPRDGRHGVDRDTDYDPYPPVHFSTRTGLGPLRVSVADAARHLAILIDRVENGDDVILTSRDHDVAKLTSIAHRQTTPSGAPSNAVGAPGPAAPAVREFEGEDQLPALPDPGPRDGRHGVEGTPPVARRGRRMTR